MADWKGVAAALVALVFSIAALAQESAPAERHFYAGGGFGEARWRPGCPSTAAECDDANPTVKAFAGYQINRIFSGEVAFTNYGKASGTNAEVKGRGWEASGLAAWPVWRQVSLYGRLGIYRGVVKGGGQFANHTESNYNATYGLGAQADFTRNIGARLEFQAFPGVGGSTIIDNDVQTVTLSALWRFR
jgi:OOP family OmpA-OmpF porin